MNRRQFLKFAALLPLVPYFTGHAFARQEAAPPLAGGQFVFDGSNGLWFLAQSGPTAASITRFRSKTFLEKLLEALK